MIEPTKLERLLNLAKSHDFETDTIEELVSDYLKLRHTTDEIFKIVEYPSNPQFDLSNISDILFQLYKKGEGPSNNYHAQIVQFLAKIDESIDPYTVQMVKVLLDAVDDLYGKHKKYAIWKKKIDKQLKIKKPTKKHAFRASL